MRSNQRDFKDTQVFGWDSEPIDERPSEFVHSTGYSALSGYYSMPDTRGVASRPLKRGGVSFLLTVSAAIISLGALGMYCLVQVLRA